ncbi:hypothetical protein PHMEG_0001071 [Phytophthora megakarya]|uniref:Uncharacterized protein n=1 Tax=Phytophthora megakarya TaxID=4795 RepID=A0A225X1H9_9STRA|nr:hypothetical protein PHMEG_0001071 [Phytophthora megakarya]
MSVYNRHRLNLNSTPTVNEMATIRTTESHTSTNIGNCANKKRYRATDSEGPDRKRPVHVDSLDEEVNRIAKCYMTSAFNAYDLIVAKGFSITDTKTLKTFSDMKAKATASNTALHDFLKRDGIPSENTLGAFKLATQMMTKVIRDFSSDAKEYSWMKETIRLLRELFAMRSCTTLRNVRDSLSDSISCLEICLEGNYKFEGDQVPILDTMEQRVQRYQNRHDIKSAMGPIQSIASALLVDVEQFTDNSCDPRTLVRTNENWSRFAAVGTALSAWMNRALQSNLPNRGSLNIPNKLVAKLRKFDAKWPDRLPPGLLRNTKSLLMRKHKR